MIKKPFSRPVMTLLACFACSGWIAAWKFARDLKLERSANPDAGYANSGPATGFRHRPKIGTTLAGLIHNPQSARLFGSLADISRSAPAGAVNEKLIAMCHRTLNNPDEECRMRDFGLLMELMRPEDAAAMHETFLTLHREGKAYGFEYAYFSTRWGEVDGAGAMSYLFSQDPPVVPAGDFRNVARGWAKQDPAGALAWMEQHPEEARNLGAYPAIMRGWMGSDPEAATSWLVGRNLSPDETVQCMATAINVQFHGNGAEAAARWLADLPDEGVLSMAASEAWNRSWGDIRELPYDRAAVVMGAVADQPWMSIHQFANYADAVSRSRSASRGMEGFLENLAETWPAEQITDRFHRWAEQDPARTSQWLTDLPPSSVRTAAIEGLVQTIETTNPDMAEAWRSLLSE